MASATHGHPAEMFHVLYQGYDRGATYSMPVLEVKSMIVTVLLKESIVGKGQSYDTATHMV